MEPLPKFVPCNPDEARRALKNDQFTIKDNEYDLLKEHNKRVHEAEKLKQLGPIFKTSQYVDNNNAKDWSLPSKLREDEFKQRKLQRSHVLQNTGDRFLIDKNDYNAFLPVADPESWGRLSILQNHKKIMQIMNANYVKSVELEKKFKNRTQKDLVHD
jgi:hypothetical protein